MYLNNKHFNNLLKEVGEDVKNFERRERLSSKAMMYSTGTKLLIFYENTLVFKKDLNGAITLNTNGWQTLTSKKWINHGFGLTGFNWCISQKKFKWYIVDGRTGANPRPYKDNITINKS